MRSRLSRKYVFSLRDRADVAEATRRGDFVRIDRRTKWGNPFRGDDAVAQYRHWIRQQPDLMRALPELRGKRLFCWCAPDSCHGDVLAELANARPRRRVLGILLALLVRREG